MCKQIIIPIEKVVVRNKIIYIKFHYQACSIVEIQIFLRSLVGRKKALLLYKTLCIIFLCMFL